MAWIGGRTPTTSFKKGGGLIFGDRKGGRPDWKNAFHTCTCNSEQVARFSYFSHSWTRFAFLRSCGCVFSEKALKEVPSDTCHKVRRAVKKPYITVDSLLICYRATVSGYAIPCSMARLSSFLPLPSLNECLPLPSFFLPLFSFFLPFPSLSPLCA